MREGEREEGFFGLFEFGVMIGGGGGGEGERGGPWHFFAGKLSPAVVGGGGHGRDLSETLHLLRSLEVSELGDLYSH